MTMSGDMRVTNNKPWIRVRPRKAYRFKPMAPKVPMRVARLAANTATAREFRAASRRASSARRLWYQTRVEPSQRVSYLDALKEFAISRPMGKYKNP